MGNESSTRKDVNNDIEEALRIQERKYERRCQELLEIQKRNLDQKLKCDLEKAKEALEEEKLAYKKKYKELEDKEKEIVHLYQPRPHVAANHFINVSEAHQRTCPIYPNLQNYDFPSTSSGAGGNSFSIPSQSFHPLTTALPSAPPQGLQSTPTKKNIDLDRQANYYEKNQKQNCPNANDGCSLSFYTRGLAQHAKECPFKEMPCPVNKITRCNWTGKLNQLRVHFQENHPWHCVADVDKEMKLPNIDEESYIVYLVVLGKFNFLVHVKVDAQSLIMMTVQMIGTKMSAAKWSYEFHAYNKLTPRRKYQYNAVCHNNTGSVLEIFDKFDCATLTATLAKSFATYKFYLKQDYKKAANTWSNQRPQ